MEFHFYYYDCFHLDLKNFSASDYTQNQMLKKTLVQLMRIFKIYKLTSPNQAPHQQSKVEVENYHS